MKFPIYFVAIVALLGSPLADAREGQEYKQRHSDKNRFAHESTRKRSTVKERSPHANSRRYSYESARGHRHDDRKYYQTRSRHHHDDRGYRNGYRSGDRRRSDYFLGGLILGTLGAHVIHDYHASSAYYHQPRTRARYWRDRHGSCFRVESRARGTVYVKVGRQWCY